MPTLDEVSGTSIFGTDPIASVDGVSFWDTMTDSNQDSTTPPSTVPKRFIRSGYKDKRIIRDDQFVFENIDSSGNGDFYYCGNKREMSKCSLITNPGTTYPSDWSAFQTELSNYPLPNITSQELISP
jgi:hypothetical protein